MRGEFESGIHPPRSARLSAHILVKASMRSKQDNGISPSELSKALRSEGFDGGY
jgi:hypothetical protein